MFSGSLFPSVSARAVAEDKEEEDEEQGEDDAPPIVTPTILPEDGSIHDVRCKLYYMDDDKKYNDFGIGQLYVKPLTSGRVQLIIRADNSLGNLIFNVAIDQSTPITKAGKNGLSIVVVPNPPIKKASGDQPTVALLRVKTDVQLTELLDKIEEAKKEASCLRNLAKS
ncbi:nuclear pore complex protein Nup50 [Trichuris trichiura]|uniref:Nuclear pore complex protein Nup50 n=1 Tax=Trichuris trichiura TaxID=36087 RepID=A0A077Z824_TRITR|nr:nuclear pore complex protein Nup50 [Trichuris trichiura]